MWAFLSVVLPSRRMAVGETKELASLLQCPSLASSVTLVYLLIGYIGQGKL